MRNPFRLNVLPESLKDLEIHELIRDFPEVASLLREAGVDPREKGTERLDPGLLSDREGRQGVRQRILWRLGAGN